MISSRTAGLLAIALAVAVATLAACGDDALSRNELCEMDCAQKLSCDDAPTFATLFGDEATCVDVCTSWELPEGCLDGVPQACSDAKLDRWACAASLSCDELDAFLEEAQSSHWELVEDDQGNPYWKTSDGDYPCNSEDAEVQDACDGIEWSGFSPECGYDGGYVAANYYDGEFDDM